MIITYFTQFSEFVNTILSRIVDVWLDSEYTSLYIWNYVQIMSQS